MWDWLLAVLSKESSQQLKVTLTGTEAETEEGYGRRNERCLKSRVASDSQCNRRGRGDISMIEAIIYAVIWGLGVAALAYAIAESIHEDS